MTTYDDVMRTIIDIPQDQIDRLDELRRRLGISRAELIRRALSSYLKDHPSAADPEEAFGIWADRAVDGLRYQDSLRAEWEEPAT
jgi:metal-responsive CopG/Arc/MetJ family transcriptional regulator